jgi:hypothetical protein
MLTIINAHAEGTGKGTIRGKIKEMKNPKTLLRGDKW